MQRRLIIALFWVGSALVPLAGYHGIVCTHAESLPVRGDAIRKSRSVARFDLIILHANSLGTYLRLVEAKQPTQRMENVKKKVRKNKKKWEVRTFQGPTFLSVKIISSSKNIPTRPNIYVGYILLSVKTRCRLNIAVGLTFMLIEQCCRSSIAASQT